MAEQALSTIGVKFGWGLGTLTQAPTSFKEIEECISISSVELSKDQIDVTPLSARENVISVGTRTAVENLKQYLTAQILSTHSGMKC